ncbi:MAG: large conductance mechanosensitive channel protein MscL [Lachnospiraceae bacterium]|nr:large conductance mechanosensitive channel protein MscL [Lachnospiraceae bacterium]
MKKFFEEFRAFASRGDAMNLAVGVIIGAAFQAIVTSLVKDIISPVIGLFVNVDFNHLVLKIGNVDIRYGAFLTAVINFIIMAFVIFILVKVMNNLTDSVNKIAHKGDKPAAPTTKVCPYCKSTIDINATRCPHCTSNL